MVPVRDQGNQAQRFQLGTKGNQAQRFQAQTKETRPKGSSHAPQKRTFHRQRGQAAEAISPRAVFNKVLPRQTRVFLSSEAEKLLSRQYICCDKYLSPQMCCRGKHTSVATKDVFCRDKHVHDTCGSFRQ